MEDKIKILELKVKLLEDIDRNQTQLIFGLKEKADLALKIWMKNRDGKSTNEKATFVLDKEQVDFIESLFFTLNSNDLTDQFSKSYEREYAKEIKTKREILNML